jgi:hypothetical protein
VDRQLARRLCLEFFPAILLAFSRNIAGALWPNGTAPQAIAGQHLGSFVQFPPRQMRGSFSVEQAMEKLRLPPASNWRNRQCLLLSEDNSAEIA